MQLKEFDSLEILTFKNSKSEFQKHFHDSYVLSFIEKGTFIENNLYGVTGNILISHPYEVHENKIFDDNPYTVTSLYINPDIIKYFSKQDNISFPEKVIDNQALFNQFKHYFSELYAGNLESNDLLIKGLNQLILTNGEKGAFQSEQHHYSFMPEILQYINQKCNEKIRLDDLAQIAKQSKYSFIRQFKKSIGITPFEYVNLQRTIQAKRHLREGRSLIETALSTGYYDQSHFSHYFKHYVGLSPHDYATRNILQDI
ncbi:MAG: helix-turn-helix transcriptional regulator [Aequorivita sp.]|nr:helix-turn-helix transcriptional regulator [Aequorivita sp.]